MRLAEKFGIEDGGFRYPLGEAEALCWDCFAQGGAAVGIAPGTCRDELERERICRELQGLAGNVKLRLEGVE